MLVTATSLQHRLPPRTYVAGHSFLLDTGAALDIPLWSGMRLHAVVQQADQMHQPIGAVCRAADASRSLREVETALIRQAMVASRGSVLKAARALGVSRATVYRRLGSQRGAGTTP